MSFVGPVIVVRDSAHNDEEFWDAMSTLNPDILALTSSDKLATTLRRVKTPRAVIIDGLGVDEKRFVYWLKAAEETLSGHHIPLICLASGSFKRPVAIHPDAILTHPVPAETVMDHMRALNRLITKRMEADVRTATLQDLNLELPQLSMPVQGGSTDNGPALLVVGTRGHFPQIESVLGNKVHIVAAMTADMANLYLGWRTFDAVVLDQPNSEAIDTLHLLRANPMYHDLPIILLTEGLDADTTRLAYNARANDVMTLRSTRADLFLRLTIAIRTRRLDRSIQETLMLCQDILDSSTGDGTVPSDRFKCYLKHARETAKNNSKPLTVTRLLIQHHDSQDQNEHLHLMERPALRLLRRLMRVEDLAVIVGGTGLISVFPATDEENAQLVIRRIRSVMRTTPVTLENGEKPVRLDAVARIASVNAAG